MSRHTHAAALSALALFALSGLALAGPLNPPAGAVTSSGKTLTDVEPRIAINATNTPGDNDSTPCVYKITQPGSYYLTGTVVGVAGKIGIEITSGDVTLDLNGYSLHGVQGSLDGVRVTFSAGAISVVNGSVRFWGGDGLDLAAAITSRVHGVSVESNSGQGIRAGSQAHLSSCVIYSNGIFGVTGLDVCTVSDCTISNNGSSGLSVLNDCTITNCSSSYNHGTGFSTLAGCTITGCTAGNSIGSGAGILVTSGCTVSNCTVANNADDGIHANDSCTITGNTVRNNGDDGIEVFATNFVSHNTCIGNDAAGDGGGLYTTGTGNRFEDNLLVGNHYGINCPGTDNFIAKNTARNNSGGNFTVLAGNELAPVITNPGSNGFATMTPWSNVAY